MPQLDDDDREDELDNEMPDESDLDPSADDSSEATEECPHCGAEIYGDSEWCPKCGRYLSEEYAPQTRKTWFVVVVVIALLLVTIWTFL